MMLPRYLFIYYIITSKFKVQYFLVNQFFKIIGHYFQIIITFLILKVTFFTIFLYFVPNPVKRTNFIAEMCLQILNLNCLYFLKNLHWQKQYLQSNWKHCHQ
jgi:hypothetical protein